MSRHFLCAVFAAILFTLSCPAFAQGDARSFRADLETLNRTSALRSPQFKNWDEVFAFRVLDGNRQLVGAVDDLRLDESGGVVSLVSTINNVGRRDKTVQSASAGVTFHDEFSAFEIPLATGGAEQISPESLAAIAPAAGGGGTLYSLRAMKGAEVRDTSGRWLGVVKSVLMDNDVRTVKALVLEDVPGASRYQEVAVPFDTAQVTVTPRYNRIQFRLTPEAAQALTEYAKDTR